MDIIEVKNIWNRVKEEIIKTVPATSHPWIIPMEAVGFENGIFSVLTGQSFAIQIIRKNHYQQIIDVFNYGTWGSKGFGNYRHHADMFLYFSMFHN